MRILITGASGQLGHELRHVLRNEQLTLMDMPDFDVTVPGVEQRIAAAKPGVVIHTAAYTDVDGAEGEPAHAMAVNAEGTERVAKAAATAGARLLYLSTDYVFDGRQGVPYREIDEPHPINAYGQSKFEGERRAIMHCPNTLVIRTAWLYGSHGRNFVKTVMRQALEQAELRVVSDQRGSPTHAGDLALAIKQILATNLKGIVHATGGGDCTWYEFAREIVSVMGSPVCVHAISTEETKRAARRPMYSVLANTVLEGQGIRLPPWKDAVTKFVRESKTVAHA